jgi:hypothetical protein
MVEVKRDATTARLVVSYRKMHGNIIIAVDTHAGPILTLVVIIIEPAMPQDIRVLIATEANKQRCPVIGRRVTLIVTGGAS